MEKVRTKIIVGRKVKEFEFTGEVKFKLRITDSKKFSGKKVCLFVEMPVTDGLNAIFELEKTHMASGARISKQVKNDTFYFCSDMSYDLLTPELFEIKGE